MFERLLFCFQNKLFQHPRDYDSMKCYRNYDNVNDSPTSARSGLIAGLSTLGITSLDFDRTIAGGKSRPLTPGAVARCAARQKPD